MCGADGSTPARGFMSSQTNIIYASASLRMCTRRNNCNKKYELNALQSIHWHDEKT
jgi:hypothetical protein